MSEETPSGPKSLIEHVLQLEARLEQSLAYLYAQRCEDLKQEEDVRDRVQRMERVLFGDDTVAMPGTDPEASDARSSSDRATQGEIMAALRELLKRRTEENTGLQKALAEVTQLLRQIVPLVDGLDVVLGPGAQAAAIRKATAAAAFAAPKTTPATAKRKAPRTVSRGRVT